MAEVRLPSALDHVNIVVTDMERSVEFYSDLLGLKKVFETVLSGAWIDEVTGLNGVEARCVFMESPGIGVRLELLQYLSPTLAPRSGLAAPHLPGIRHLAFRVDDIAEFHAYAAAKGVRFVSGPVSVPFAIPGGIRKRLCYFHDPDGVLVEAADYRIGNSAST